MKTYIIRLESHDDVTSIRDKIAWSKATRILLAFPQHRSPLLGQVDLNLICRQAEQLGSQVALVAKDRELSANARSLGIPVFASIAEAQRQPWMLPRRRRGVIPQVDRNIEVIARGETFRPVGNQSIPRWARVAVFMLGLTSFFALIFIFIPSATIHITPQRIEQELTMEFWANQVVPAASAAGGLPVREQSTIVEGSLEAVGSLRTTIGYKTAEGRLILTNLTDSLIEVPTDTVFQTSGQPRARFVTRQAVVIPAGVGQTAEVPVQALTAGAAGNVPAHTIQAVEGSLGWLIAATNPEPTTGGSDREALAASEQDYEQLYDTLLTSLIADALEQMEMSAGEPVMLVPGSLKVNEVLNNTRIPPTGQPTDRIRLDLRLEFSALAVAISDIESAARLALNASLPEGYQPISNGVNIVNLGEPIVDESGTIRWKGRISRMVEKVWDADEILGDIAGLMVHQASTEISTRLNLTNPPEIMINPSWWIRMPFLAFRMKMVEK